MSRAGDAGKSVLTFIPGPIRMFESFDDRPHGLPKLAIGIIDEWTEEFDGGWPELEQSRRRESGIPIDVVVAEAVRATAVHLAPLAVLSA